MGYLKAYGVGTVCGVRFRTVDTKEGPKDVASVRVACSKGRDDEHATFMSVEVWGKGAAELELLEPGTRVMIDCTLATNRYTNKEGVEREELRGRQLFMPILRSGTRNEGSAEPAAPSRRAEPAPARVDDFPPF